MALERVYHEGKSKKDDGEYAERERWNVAIYGCVGVVGASRVSDIGRDIAACLRRGARHCDGV